MAKNYVPELLAPAGSLDALKAAVNAGADAVYISGKKFGARKFATNFSNSEIEEGLKYAKLRGVKIYVTVNTLMKDSQMQSVAKYLIWLYKIGVDAVIIQDLGVAYLSRKIVPNMKMHASTQMTIHNTPGVEWASKFGFKRVVLSRELAISEVENIKSRTANSGIEIEIFGHGALCYSYSGQCLLSSFIGGRSGNRGMCAQPCRKQYTLLAGNIDRYGKPVNVRQVNLKDQYLLSTRDLAVYKNLERISNSRVDSLKIEGRMRSAEYVAVVVKIYRNALDSITKGKWKPNFEDISKLKIAFNRGFTGGYLTEEDKKSVMGRDAPGNRGLYIGKVQDYQRKTVTLKIENRFKLKKGDGIVFISPYNQVNKSKNKNRGDTNHGNMRYNETYGMALEEPPKYHGDKLTLKVGKAVTPGSRLFLNRSISMNHEAREIIKKSISPTIPMDMVMTWDNELKALLNGEFTGFDGAKHKVHLKSGFRMEKAIKRPLNRDQIENQLQKTGKTPFVLKNVSIEYSGDLFAPISKLNQFRREFLEKAELKLLSTYKPSESNINEAENLYEEFKNSISPANEQFEEPEKYSWNMLLAVYANSLETVKGALEGGAKRIYFEPTPHKVLKDISTIKNSKGSLKFVDENYSLDISSKLSKAKKLCKTYHATLIWKWPQITHQDQLDLYYKFLESQPFHDFNEIMVDGLGAAEWVKQVAPQFKLCGSAGINIWNKNSVLILSKLFNTLTPSAELSKEDLRTVIWNSRSDGFKKHFELVVQGNMDTLISNDCLLSIVPEEDIVKQDRFWGIQDRKKRIFPIEIDSEGHTHILNSVELCLVDHLPEISKIGVDCVVVDVRNKTYDYAKDMTRIYSTGLEYIEMGVMNQKNMNQLKSQIKNISTGGITTGNFLKGIKEK